MQTNILNSTVKVFEKTSFETRFGVFLPFFWVVAFLFVQKWKVKNIAFKLDLQGECETVAGVINVVLPDTYLQKILVILNENK